MRAGLAPSAIPGNSAALVDNRPRRPLRDQPEAPGEDLDAPHLAQAGEDLAPIRPWHPAAPHRPSPQAAFDAALIAARLSRRPSRLSRATTPWAPPDSASRLRDFLA